MLKKQIIKEGTGYIKPHDATECRFNIEVKGYGIESDCVTLVIGNSIHKFSDTLEGALSTMTIGETAKFYFVFSELNAYILQFSANDSNFNVTESKQNESDLCECEIEMTFQNSKPSYEMTSQEKYDRALHHKTFGSIHFQNGDFPTAFKRYSQAIKYLIFMQPEYFIIPEPLLQDYYKLRSQCYLNLAACQLKKNSYNHVIENCTKALKYDNSNVKGFYRRGVAYIKTNKLDKAKLDFESGLRYEPNNLSLRKLLRDLSS